VFNAVVVEYEDSRTEESRATLPRCLVGNGLPAPLTSGAPFKRSAAEAGFETPSYTAKRSHVPASDPAVHSGVASLAAPVPPLSRVKSKSGAPTDRVPPPAGCTCRRRACPRNANPSAPCSTVCHSCKQTGHIARQCPSAATMVASILASDFGSRPLSELSPFDLAAVDYRLDNLIASVYEAEGGSPVRVPPEPLPDPEPGLYPLPFSGSPLGAGSSGEGCVLVGAVCPAAVANDYRASSYPDRSESAPITSEFPSVASSPWFEGLWSHRQ
jgi:hypothetical protein